MGGVIELSGSGSDDSTRSAASSILALPKSSPTLGVGLPPTWPPGDLTRTTRCRNLERMFETRCPDCKTTVGFPDLPGDTTCYRLRPRALRHRRPSNRTPDSDWTLGHLQGRRAGGRKSPRHRSSKQKSRKRDRGMCES